MLPRKWVEKLGEMSEQWELFRVWMFATESNCKYCKVQNGEVGLMGCEWGTRSVLGLFK